MKRLVLICVVTALLIACKSESILNGNIAIVTNSGRHIQLADVEVVAITEKDLAPYIEVKKIALALAAGLHRRQNEFDAAQRNYHIASENFLAAIDRFTFANREFATAIKSGSDIEKQGTLYDANVAERNADEAGVLKKNQKAKMNIALIELQTWPTANFFFKDIPWNKTVKALSNATGQFSLNLVKGKYAIAAHLKRPVSNGSIEYYWFCWINIENPVETIVLNNSNLMETNSPDSIMIVGFAQ